MLKRKTAYTIVCTVLVSILPALCAGARDIRITVDAWSQAKAISPILFGIFFEDISYAADGGLYAEMVQNRSFEYTPLDQPHWHAFTSWELTERDGGRITYYLANANPIHPNNPHYVELHIDAWQDDAAAGIANSGFDGMVIKAGENYNFSVFARQQPGNDFSLEARLESEDGTLLGKATVEALTQQWQKYSAVIEAEKDGDNARLVLLAKNSRGVVYLDMVSLFPEKTFLGRENGLRADLAQALADLQPGFMRFPGGCVIHGDGLVNFYNWKDTIGPVEQRKAQRNIWRYHQSKGLGYFEYFQFCRDIGAEPVPVVPAAVSCQNTDRYWGVGQQAIPLGAEMDAYVQDVLDLIEWANGPADSKWGAKRAAAGSTEPFDLKYLAVGNEDAQTPEFKERFEIIYQAVKEKYPDVTVIGNVGPAPDGDEFERGWRFARQQGLQLVAEHYYRNPQWFLDNLQRYDHYDRSKANVFVSEYAAHDDGRRTTLRAALAEAAFMTGLERNGDIVSMACYAPLFAKIGHTRWNPNLIYFTNTQVFPTISYYVQKMFSTNAGTYYLPSEMEGSGNNNVAFSAVRDSDGDLILKIVNPHSAAKVVNFELSDLSDSAIAEISVLAGDNPDAANHAGSTQMITPETHHMEIGQSFDYELPGYSVNVIRIPH